MSPVPPITTIFMIVSFIFNGWVSLGISNRLAELSTGTPSTPGTAPLSIVCRKDYGQRPEARTP